MFNILKSKVSFFDEQSGAFVEKVFNDLNPQEMKDFAICLINENEVLKAEKAAIVTTMNKFLSKDHETALQKLMEKNQETDRVY